MNVTIDRMLINILPYAMKFGIYKQKFADINGHVVYKFIRWFIPQVTDQNGNLDNFKKELIMTRLYLTRTLKKKMDFRYNVTS